MNFRDPPPSGLNAPNQECQNDLDRIALIVDEYVEQGICDGDTAVLDIITDALIYNRFASGREPGDLLERAERAYFSQLAEANVWA
jgi:hypothetical protein